MNPPRYFLYASKSTDEDDHQILPARSLADGSIESQLTGTPPNHLRQGFCGPPKLPAKAEGFGRRAELREFACQERLTIAVC